MSATATRHARVTESNGKELQVTACECLSAFIDDTDTHAMQNALADESTSWIGRDLRSNARRKAIQLHAPTMQAIDDARDEVRDVTLPQPVTRSRRVRFDEFDGDDICLDRLRDGVPFWRTSQRQQTAGPQNVTIGVDLSAHGGVESKAIAWRGVAGILLAELLENAGIRVELWAIAWSDNTYHNGDSRLVAIKCKSADAPLDTIAIGNAFSGWFLRSFILHAFRNSAFGSKVRRGLGTPTTPTAERVSAVVGVEFDAIVADCFDRSACLQTVETLLKRFGNVDA